MTFEDKLAVALFAYNAAWEASSNITALTVDKVRCDAMAEALVALGVEPTRTQPCDDLHRQPARQVNDRRAKVSFLPRGRVTLTNRQ